MAGRYLLIEFDDEASASSLRAQIDNATKKGKRFRVVGLFARPGTSCICLITQGQRAKDIVQRGGKFGWWLCKTCGKPRLGDHQLKNLITPPEILSPSLLAGVDTLYIPVETRNYIRHTESISLITMPERVASGNAS